MSMEHKGFVFDTEKFHAEIEPVMRAAVGDMEIARQFISDHCDELQSPYTGERLDEGWEEEFADLSLQVCFDIMLTACYDVEEDLGLGYMWDAVSGLIAELDVFEDPEVALLGREVDLDGVRVDPGMMGLGLVESGEVEDILDILLEHRDDAGEVELDESVCDAEPEEWLEAYDQLCDLYEEAAGQGRGLLFTF